MDQIKIGNFLKALRREKGLTQEQLAEQLNVSARTISRWETGSNMPDISLLIEIAEFYDVSIPEIVSGERKDEPMTEETRNTALSLSEYSESEKTFLLKGIRAKSLLGVLAMAVYAALDITGLSQYNRLLELISVYSLTLVFVETMVIALYTTGLVLKIENKKKQLNLPRPLVWLLAAIAGLTFAYLLKFLMSLLPL
ncbi:MAG: helix-turn-helix transcriptional regulator [Clostridia bacterium]|nr:helix-turn-helix transcriptional regulator [Clostridia bacterium]